MSFSPEYAAWTNAKKRCKNVPSYYNRGITMCEEWINYFQQFYQDMGDRPGPDYSLDRINNDLGYSASNCRWATAKTQANNRSNQVLITHNGLTLTVEEWSKKINISPATIYKRLQKTTEVSDILSERLRPGAVINPDTDGRIN